MDLSSLSGRYVPPGTVRLPQSSATGHHFDLASQPRKSGQATDQNGSIVVYLPKENTVFSGGGMGGQSVYAEYTKDSTAEDPIVSIKGSSLSGDYDMIVHINDIDPANASYAEMCALLGHLKKTGQYDSSQSATNPGIFSPVPPDINRGNYTTKKDYLGLLQSSVSSNQQTGNHQMANTGASLLSLFESWMAQKPDQVAAMKTYLESASDANALFSKLLTTNEI